MSIRLLSGVAGQYGDTSLTRKVLHVEFPTTWQVSYLFDNLPLPLSLFSSPLSFTNEDLPSPPSSEMSSGGNFDGMLGRSLTPADFELIEVDWFEHDSRSLPFGGWDRPVVDKWFYGRVWDAMQSRWIAFTWGEHPRDNTRGKVFVFGPEGETGERTRVFPRGEEGGRFRNMCFALSEWSLCRRLAVELSNRLWFVVIPPGSSRHKDSRSSICLVRLQWLQSCTPFSTSA